MLKRSLHQSWKTEWTDVLHKHQPRFAHDSVVTLTPSFRAKGYNTDSPFKLSFSFSNSRFMIPWVTVSDGSGHFLHIIEFTFIFAGNDIVKVTTATQYHEVKGVKPEHIYLVYRWQEHRAQNSHLALNSLFTAGFVVSILLLVAGVWEGLTLTSPNSQQQRRRVPGGADVQQSHKGN